jgi:type II secretory pathway pseudopilin PulG
MVALLVAMGVMAVMLSAAMPVWKQLSTREKETELIFRGQQYARAIGLFQRKAGPGVLPPNIDLLVQQKFLRRKYKDPITGQDFDLLTQAQAAPGGPGGAARGQSPPSAARGQPPPSAAGGAAPSGPTPMGSVVAQPAATPGAQQGGIVGVASKSKATSIRLYNGRNHYNEWQFVFVQQVQAPGAPGPGGVPQRGGAPQPGQPPLGPPGIGRGGRGSQPFGPSGPFGPGSGGGGRGPTPPGPVVPGRGTPQPTPGN